MPKDQKGNVFVMNRLTERGKQIVVKMTREQKEEEEESRFEVANAGCKIGGVTIIATKATVIKLPWEYKIG
ncbi:MAG: hypothetical protein ACJ70S_04205 [Nitrososphaera sp.]